LAGIGRGSAQVLYHQQQRTVATRMQQSSGPGTPQHAYSTQQPLQTVAAGYGPQQNAPAFTTQSQQQTSGGTAPQGYSSQQQVCRYSILFLAYILRKDSTVYLILLLLQPDPTLCFKNTFFGKKCIFKMKWLI
jgi:hypothetical protein